MKPDMRCGAYVHTADVAIWCMDVSKKNNFGGHLTGISPYCYCAAQRCSGGTQEAHTGMADHIIALSPVSCLAKAFYKNNVKSPPARVGRCCGSPLAGIRLEARTTRLT